MKNNMHERIRGRLRHLLLDEGLHVERVLGLAEDLQQLVVGKEEEAWEGHLLGVQEVVQACRVTKGIGRYVRGIRSECEGVRRGPPTPLVVSRKQERQ